LDHHDRFGYSVDTYFEGEIKPLLTPLVEENKDGGERSEEYCKSYDLEVMNRISKSTRVRRNGRRVKR